MPPDFLIIGAQKAGTTWLHRNLQAHPGVWMPKEKELHYFDEKIRADPSLFSKLFGQAPEDKRWRRQASRQLKSYKKGVSLEDLAWDFRYFLGMPGDGWYVSLFEQGRGRVTGEATPDYSVLRRVKIAHVREVVPDAKIVFMMRNPIERAWSQALMGFERRRPLDSVTDKQFHRHFGLDRVRLLGDYLKTLENWGKFFPEDRIFVGFLEDVNFAPDGMMERLYGFLGADTTAKYRVIKKKIHTRSVETIPTRHAVTLANIYREEIERLSGRFGGYADFWLYCAERLTEDPPGAESLSYPLWESSLWEDWGGPGRIALQSGQLSRVRAAS